MSRILCIETGTNVCSVALAENYVLISLIESREGQQHAQNLGTYVDEILRENELSVKDLDAVAVSKGPGSYTGLRIGVSLAKGICYAAHIPLIAINSLESLTHVMLEDYEAGILGIHDLDNATLCPMIDARRMEVYCQLFDTQANSLSDVEAKIITADSFREIWKEHQLILFGNGATKSKEVLLDKNIKLVMVSPSARGLIGPACSRYENNDFEDVAYFEPFYLKDFVVMTSAKPIF